MKPQATVSHPSPSHPHTLTPSHPPPQVYRDKLRSLRRVSRAVFRRVEEAEKRPVLAARLRSSLNISHDFLFRMHNLSGEVQIFTEVEMTSLETLINETEVRRTHTVH